ncbi:NUDIX hydrolase [Alteromonadaceae bacterium BrNp21-10]|nr:NUDIX hydrolase [Alteromonadaceae bacterium BrNp21-10]
MIERVYAKQYFVSICLFLVISCSSEQPADPICRIDDRHFDTHSGNAGCVIRLQNRLMSITHRLSGKYDIPGGTSASQETAQCTAHRETWQETGFNVEVGELLGEKDNGFRFYQCTLSGNFTGEISQFPVPDWSQSEVTAIQLVDPFATPAKQWRYPDELILLRDMFNKVD